MNTPPSSKVTVLHSEETFPERLHHGISKAQKLLLKQQYPDGFWWYTLEANESIGAEFLFLLHVLKLEKKYSKIQKGLIQRMLQEQREDGSWGIYYGAPGDISTTLECYLALKMAGHDTQSSPLKHARDFILSKGGVTQSRVFTKIHLALFGLIPWDACPAMPSWFILFPNWFPFNIYEFSSWARACIVPLLVVLTQKKTFPLSINIDELFVEKSVSERNWSLATRKGFFSAENFFIQIDRLLKLSNGFSKKIFFQQKALKTAEKWIVEHVNKTEDIYPAMAYSAVALHILGHDLNSPSLKKCLEGLLFFHQRLEEDLPALPIPAHIERFEVPESFNIPEETTQAFHQQCCISPVWDTPWTTMALLESGLPANHPALQKAAEWLISKQITQTYGDWAIKNKKARPGGWSFEFENEYFPDVDDTLEILQFLYRVDLPREVTSSPFQRGLDWLMSMQCDNGGWAAFDKNNQAKWVNKIPFSDHGACLDPPTPDITGRTLELLGYMGYSAEHPACKKALHFLENTQENDGSWEGRWGVNYIYGTWCVLQGLQAMGISSQTPCVQKASQWLKSIQNSEGAWSESCESYLAKKYVPLENSVASQTAWAIMGLLAAGEGHSVEVKKGIEYLLNHQNSEGSWNEKNYTGTGFPGHFYIRYHGYRHYFPLLALGKYEKLSRVNVTIST